MSDIRDDILPEELTEEQRVIFNDISTAYIPATYADAQTTVRLRDKERVRAPSKARDIDTFFSLVKEAVDDKQTDEGITESNRVRFTEEFPPTDLESVTVAYSIQSRQPAGMSGKPFEGRKDFKPRIRGIEDHPEIPNHKIYTITQHFENEVNFTVWAETNKTANQKAMWFEDLMREYAWFFRYNGIGEVFFMKRSADIVMKEHGDGNLLCGRPMIYYVRTEKITLLSVPTIYRIIVNQTTKMSAE
jgi:hypothetical protein